jgi:predicted DNA-binding transcriptional regulator AlpA
MEVIMMSNNLQNETVEILTEIEAAQYIGMSRSFLNADRSNGHRKNRTKGPAFLKLGRSVRYRKTDLDEWLKTNRVVR